MLFTYDNFVNDEHRFWFATLFALFASLLTATATGLIHVFGGSASALVQFLTALVGVWLYVNALAGYGMAVYHYRKLYKSRRG